MVVERESAGSRPSLRAHEDESTAIAGGLEMGLEGVLLPRIYHKAVSVGISINAGKPIDLLSLRLYAKPVHEEEDTPGQEVLPGQVSLSLMDSLFPIGSAACPEKYGIVHLRRGTGGP